MLILKRDRKRCNKLILANSHRLYKFRTFVGRHKIGTTVYIMHATDSLALRQMT
jgi:hypothetical protein